MKRMVKPALPVMLAIAMCFGSMSVFAAENTSVNFSDVTPDSYGWAATYVDSIAAKGIATGVGNNKFDPGSYIKRGDFAVFLDKTFKFDQKSDELFNIIDVDKDKYYYSSVVNCKLANAITDANNFYPEEYITRLDAINYIYNAMTVQSLIGSNGSTDVSKYADNSELLNMTDKISVGTLTNMGILSGSSDGKLHPNDNLTRAEMAVIFAKTSDYVDEVKAKKELEKEEKKQQLIEDSKAKTEEVSEDGVESTLVSSGNIDESVKIDTGKNFNMHDVTMKISSQEADAIAVSNGSTLSLKDSVIRSAGYPAISATDSSTVKLDSDSIEVEAPRGITLDKNSELRAEDTVITAKGATSIAIDKSDATFDNCKINSSDSENLLTINAGSNLTINDSEISQTSKSSKVFNVSNDEYDSEQLNISVSGTNISVPKGSAINYRDSVSSIAFDNCTIDANQFISVDDEKNNKQTTGCDSLISLKDSSVTGDIVVDSNTILTLDIQEGAHFKGHIDEDLHSQSINIRLDDNGKLELLGDIYVNEFIVSEFIVADLSFNNIVDNGFNIYYDDTISENAYLYSDTFMLPYGGKLLPR